IESLPFLEAIRQYRHEIGAENAIFIHLTLIPYIRAAGEMKTKPSQQSVGILRGIGIAPDILVCRSEKPMAEEHFEKLSLFCNVKREFVIEERDVANSIYEVPLELAKQELDGLVLDKLELPVNELLMDDWRKMVETVVNPPNGSVEIAVVGKYISLQDSYKSIYEALAHGGIANGVKVDVRMIEAEDIENDSAEKYLDGVAGILVPGGFGDRGVEGKIKAIEYARTKNIPFFGICLGMQCAVIEFARNVAGLEGAHSAEFSEDTKHPVIDLMERQKKIVNKGGTMRLGAWSCRLDESSRSLTVYGASDISERHRHRYEFNSDYLEVLKTAGLSIVGVSPESGLVEIVEIDSHPWFVACQFHPEFKSTPLNAHPLFKGFIRSSMDQ
ncbi:MAG: CTP synthase, partial [Victivallales bacterium]|nr:CTP synthase [Victivallales bacterium]